MGTLSACFHNGEFESLSWPTELAFRLSGTGNRKRCIELHFAQVSLAAEDSLPPCAGRGFSRLFLSDDAATINGMLWFEILVRPIVDWLLELPADLLGRKVERLLDRAARRNRRRRSSWRGKLRKGRKGAKPRR
jgi:hypothetical protein